jgi:solute carrier family 31 (copper transporter), member 1
MLFTWDTTNLCVVFRWWHVRGPVSLALTLLGIVGLGMSYELLRLIARKYDDLGTIRLATPTEDDRPQTVTAK